MRTVSRAAILLLAAALAAGCARGASAPGPAPEPAAAADADEGGYAPQPGRQSTGAIASVSSQAVDDGAFTRIEELLQGRVAGVQVVRGPGGEFSIRIRGATSFYGDSEPLVVIDGMIAAAGSLGSTLGMLNPRDVKRIDVLKDAGSTAIYGARGANGVLVITTKRGS